MTVALHIEDGVGIVRFDNPPVNALSARAGIPLGILVAVQGFKRDSAVAAIVIAGDGRMFSGGADVAEFGDNPAEDVADLRALLDGLDAITKPIVAAVHGTALGGGLELTIAAHWRVAAPGTRLGLPEVMLGIIPGGRGTQRLPRLCGVEQALSLITSGRLIDVVEALSIGLIDRIGEGTDPVLAAAAFARDLAHRPDRVRRIRDLTATADPELFATWRAKSRESLSLNTAPLRATTCIEAAVSLPYADGVVVEDVTFNELMVSDVSRALRHAFLGERQVARIPGLAAVATEPVERVGIVGAGTMGSGIAIAILDAGLPVILVDPDAVARERGVARIRSTFAGQVGKGRLTETAAAERLTRLVVSTDLDALSDVDLVIEAIFEDLAVKRDVFRRLDAVAKRGAILATNTSTLDVDAIASVTGRPSDVVGTHFFSPANIMKLLEVVRGAATAPAVLARTMGFAKRIRKTAVVAGVCDGFIGNRIFEEYLRQAYFLLDEGALPQEIDSAMEGWGMAMGPLRTMDLAGQDIGWAIRKRRAIEQPDRPYSRIPDLICERGRFGQKTGAGFYLYPDGSRVPLVDAAINDLVRDESVRLRLPRRVIPASEIVERCLLAMINEGAKIMVEGIAYRPVDIDVVYLTGYGMAAMRGGPMFQADLMGLDHVVQRMRHHAAGYQGWALKPADSLVALAASGATFAALNGRPT